MTTLAKSAFQLVETLTGFDLHATSPTRLLEFVARRAQALNFPSAHQYVLSVQSAPADDPEVERLINLVTNGLTCFWRDEPQLEAFRMALRETHQRKRGQSVDIWCAGCSTGEEVYTLAMIAREEEIPVRILGTDLNTEFLCHAEDRQYDTWSLRRLDSDRRDEYFEQLGPELWRVRDILKKPVVLKRHNILEQPPRFRPTADIIICRNVLIYFTESARRRAVENFGIALHRDGYLLLGSSEHLDDEWGLFRASRQASGFVYRHATKDAGTTMPILLDDLDLDIPPPMSFESGDEANTLDFDDYEAILQLLEQAQAHAAKDDYERALACYDGATSYDPFVVHTYVLMAAALEDHGAPIRAIETYRKALFLQPLHWFSAYRLGFLLERNGELKKAKQAYRQTLEGLMSPAPLTEHPFEALKFPAQCFQPDNVWTLTEAALHRLLT